MTYLNTPNNTTKGYASWFDTPYYYKLYRDRDYAEAQVFMDNLIHYLNVPEGGKILDLACGRGRHSVYLSKLGYNTTGADLSENSIAYAKQFESDTLHFKVHDMSKPFPDKFDAVFNLFTSFGYFKNDDDNLNTIKAIKANLKKHGFGVIDFMNLDYVIKHLIPQDTKTVDGITFNQKRYIKEGYLYKDIEFTDAGKNYAFQERVKTLRLADFEAFLETAGMYLLDVFGDYKLQKFNVQTSPRLILIFS